MLPAGAKITSEILWWGALILAAIDAGFVSILAWRINLATFRRFKWALTSTSAIFWCALWTWGLTTFWDSIYHYVFPAWAHWLIPPIFGLLYAGTSLLFWWLALRFGGNALINFCLLGGLWGMLTHLLGVYLGIVNKPPALQGAAPAAAVVFAVFEFIFYWCTILSVSTLAHTVLERLRQASVQIE